MPDTTKPAVSGAWVPKLVSSADSKTGAMEQAIQQKENATSGDYSYSYDSSKVTYTPSANTLSYYKNVNSQWSAQRGNIAFSSLEENEQSACYLADADIFAGIKDQVNNAEGNLKGKIQTLVGGASIEQWCKAYNKQSEAKDHKITCEYDPPTIISSPGYKYKVNGTVDLAKIVGNHIYGAEHFAIENSFYAFWWLASPSSFIENYVCSVNGVNSDLYYYNSYSYYDMFSLFASVALDDISIDKKNLTFTATPSGWTNGNVSVKVSTTVTGYTLQTSTDGKTWGTTNPLIFTANGTAYARLWDGNNAGAVATTSITNIDKTAPTISISGEAGATSVKINATTSDRQSGINSSSLKYKIDNGTWQTSNVFDNLDPEKTYTFVAQVTDNAGNTTESNKISVKPLEGVFAKLYDTDSDGTGDTLTFGNKSNFAYNGTLKKDYGDIKENHQWSMPWKDSSKNITKVEFVTEVKPHYTANWFYNFEKLNTIKSIKNLNTSNVTDMNSMFEFCSSLTSLDVSNLNTSNVTDMNRMFDYCSSLTSLDLSNFDTSNVTNMSFMFDNCKGLTSLNLSNFNTSNVTNMSYMFAICSSLTSLDLSNFNTSKVTDMSCMFASCSSLTSLDLSNFNTSNVTNMGWMFYGCSSLTSLNVSNFNTSKVTDMDSMFDSCRGLTSLNVSNFNTSKVTNMSGMFMICSKLTSLDVRNFDTSKVTNIGFMFSHCTGLTSLNVSNFNTSKVTDMHSMFADCEGLTSLDVSSFDTSNVTDMSSMFEGPGPFVDPKLTTIYVDSNKWSTTNVTSSDNMFYNCTKLKGQRGTVYSSSHVDASYAKVDGGTSNPGYLTQK